MSKIRIWNRCSFVLASSMLAAVTALVGCGSTVSGTNATGIQDGYPTDVDEMSPLVITTIAPEPIPVTGTDGKVHVSYELQVLNASPRSATITNVETLEGGPQGTVVASISGEQVAARSLQIGTYSPGTAARNEIPNGRAALILIDDVYDDKADVPEWVTHRISATFGDVPASEPAFASAFPDRVTQIGGVTTTSTLAPVVIGPPLAGDDWLAMNGCCDLSPHRGAMLPVGGRINGSERYAIDYSIVDLNAKPVVDLQARTVATFKGDPKQNASYLAFDQPVLAVADGTVVRVVSDMPDIEPRILPEDLELDEFGGNRVVVDIGDGVFAFFAHLKQGSPTVKVGDRVARGQVVGRLGNSGNTSEPHLHFQLSRAAASLSGDNMPYEIDSFIFLGNLSPDGLVNPPPAGPRTNELPLEDSITSYPAGG